MTAAEVLAAMHHGASLIYTTITKDHDAPYLCRGDERIRLDARVWRALIRDEAIRFAEHGVMCDVYKVNDATIRRKG